MGRTRTLPCLCLPYCPSVAPLSITGCSLSPSLFPFSVSEWSLSPSLSPLSVSEWSLSPCLPWVASEPSHAVHQCPSVRLLTTFVWMNIHPWRFASEITTLKYFVVFMYVFMPHQMIKSSAAPFTNFPVFAIAPLAPCIKVILIHKATCHTLHSAPHAHAHVRTCGYIIYGTIHFTTCHCQYNGTAGAALLCQCAMGDMGSIRLPC